MKIYILQVDLRYLDTPKSDYFSEYQRKVSTEGIYDTNLDAINAGNKVLKELAIHFNMNGVFSTNCNLVTNLRGVSNGVQVFVSIKELDFFKLEDVKYAIEANNNYLIKHNKIND